MVFQTNYDIRTYKRLYRYFAGKVYFKLNLIFTIIAAIILFVIDTYYGAAKELWVERGGVIPPGLQVFYLILIGLIITFMVFILMTIISRISLKNLAKLHSGPYTFDITEKGIQATGPLHTYFYSWLLVSKIQNHKSYIVIFIDKTDFISIPKEQLPDTDSFKQYAKGLINAAKEKKADDALS